MDVPIRAATAADEPFLRAMLYEAAAWREREPIAVVLARPETAKYLDGWPRPGDRGVVAERLGATWARTFSADDGGYGFVAEDVPELTIAVVAEARGRGLGELLLRTLGEQLRDGGVRAVSLSVEDGNPAARLYARVGFRPVGRVGGATTMLLQL